MNLKILKFLLLYYIIITMKLHLFNIANFRTDGGAMFGVVPKILWSGVYPSDENNLAVYSSTAVIRRMRSTPPISPIILATTGGTRPFQGFPARMRFLMTLPENFFRS